MESTIKQRPEAVNHPSHYAWMKEVCGFEPIHICRHFNFNIGNALKYLLRKNKFDSDLNAREKRIEDLKKAIFYIQDEINALEHATYDYKVNNKPQ